jgi:putative ATP-binding cassette transporter
VRPGERLVIQGPSGSGKTTLFRVLAGLWPYGRGTIRLPKDARVLFLPQKPYLPVGTLREALCFPERPDAHGLIEICEALRATGLEHLADRLDEERFWSPVLSPGEQQRLAVARALLLRPDWLFLDEATSALEVAMETRLYRLLRDLLPETAIISIAHNPSVVAFHERRLVFDPAARRLRSEPVALAG